MQNVLTPIRPAMEWFQGNKRLQLVYPLIVACLLILFEVTAYLLGGWFSFFASRLWIAMAVVFIISLLYSVGLDIFTDIKARRIVPLLVLVFAGVMVFGHLGDIHYAFINHEATVDLGKYLKDHLNQPDWGYTKTILFGYPSRATVFAIIPSLLFEHNIVTLQVGYAFVFYTGVLSLFVGARRFFGTEKFGGEGYLYATVLIASIFAFPALIDRLYQYHSTSYPVAFSMHVLGWFLLCLDRMTFIRFHNLTWSACLLGTTYTPALASVSLFALILLFITARCLKNKAYTPALQWGCMLLVVTAFTACSFFTRKDVNILGSGDPLTLSFVIKQIVPGYQMFFLGKPIPFYHPFLMFFVWLYFIQALLLRFGWLHVLLCLWMIAVIAFAVGSKGYALLSPMDFIHRGNIVIPVLMLSIVYLFATRIVEQLTQYKRSLLQTVVVLLIGIGLFGVATKREPFNTDKVLVKLLELAKQEQLQGEFLYVYNLSQDRSILENFYDYNNYFFPDWRYTRDPNEFQLLPDQLFPIIVLYYDDVKNPLSLPGHDWVNPHTAEVEVSGPGSARKTLKIGIYKTRFSLNHSHNG